MLLTDPHRCGGGVAADGSFHLVFDDIAIRRREQAFGEAAAHASGCGLNQIGAENQIGGVGGGGSAAAASRVVAAGASRDIHRVGGNRRLAYSRMRMSGATAALEKVTVTIFAPAAAGKMLPA